MTSQHRLFETKPDEYKNYPTYSNQSTLLKILTERRSMSSMLKQIVTLRMQRQQ